jgi:hypothetical protein
MKKIHLIALFLLIAWIASIRQIYIYHQVAKRQKNNYEAALSGVRKFYRKEVAIHQVKPQTLTRAEAKELFAQEFAFLEKQLGLRKVSQVIKLTGSTGGTVKTQVKDSSIQIPYSQNTPVLARTFSYADSNINLYGLELNDTLTIRYKYIARLTIARSLEPRGNFWKKITLQPLKRDPVYSCISKDTSFILDQFSVIDVIQ